MNVVIADSKMKSKSRVWSQPYSTSQVHLYVRASRNGPQWPAVAQTLPLKVYTSPPTYLGTLQARQRGEDGCEYVLQFAAPRGPLHLPPGVGTRMAPARGERGGERREEQGSIREASIHPIQKDTGTHNTHTKNTRLRSERRMGTQARHQSSK